MHFVAALDTIRAVVRATPLTDAESCQRQLVLLRAARGVLDSRELEIAAHLETLHRPVDDDLAAAARSSTAHGGRVNRRRATCDDVPELGDALAAGATTGDRVDVVGRALAGLPAADRSRLLAHGDAIARAASELTDRQFREWLEQLLRRVRADDGRSRLERQKAAARLRWWTDGDGMWCLHGRLDPEAGAMVQGRLRRITERLFAAGDAAPGDGVPTDALDRQQWLQASALVAALGLGGHWSGRADRADHAVGSGDTSSADDLDDGGRRVAEPRGGGGPDITVLIDAESLLHGPHDRSRIDTGGFGLPIDTIRRWACLGSVTPVVVGVDGVRLLLGRTTRLANRAQRRALEVWHRTCSLCDTPFERCDVHHVHPWELGGGTDLHNLIPLCTRHHHAVHEGGWHLTLHIDRSLTVRLPDGTVREHPPPLARAA